MKFSNTSCSFYHWAIYVGEKRAVKLQKIATIPKSGYTWDNRPAVGPVLAAVYWADRTTNAQQQHTLGQTERGAFLESRPTLQTVTDPNDFCLAKSDHFSMQFMTVSFVYIVPLAIS